MADNVLSHGLATHMLLRSLPPGEERRAVERERARLQWQMSAAIELDTPPAGSGATIDTAATQALLRAWREPGATELGVLRRRLERAGVALDPPPDWRSGQSIEPARARDSD
jgi:hypothetical protein